MKYLCLIALLFGFLSGRAQVYKYKCFEATAKGFESSKKVVEWDSVNFLIVINFNKNKVHIYARKETDYDLIKVLSDENEEKEPDTEWVIYKAIDQEGEECTLKIKVFKKSADQHIATLIVQFEKGALAYRLRQND